MRSRDMSANVIRGSLIALIAALIAPLAWAVWSLPEEGLGLRPKVVMNLPQSGASHPVTAVLLNFRGYDTLLEIAALLIVSVGAWSLGEAQETDDSQSPVSPVQRLTSQVLIPLMILTAGYFLWVGTKSPGGAFQAGALLGAAGVLLILGGWTPAPSLHWPVRISLTLGLLVFVVVGTSVMAAGGYFLEYPASWAGTLILLIETAATLSIGLILTAVYVGGQPRIWIDHLPGDKGESL